MKYYYHTFLIVVKNGPILQIFPFNVYSESQSTLEENLFFTTGVYFQSTPPGLVKEHAFWHFVPFPKQIKIIPYNVVTSII